MFMDNMWGAHEFSELLWQTSISQLEGDEDHFFKKPGKWHSSSFKYEAVI